MNIENINNILRSNGLQEFPLDFVEQLNNKNINLLKQINNAGWNPLMFILSNNKYQELGFTREDILNIINLYPEQLLNIDKYGYNPLMYIIEGNKTQELGFNFNDINSIYEQQINKEYTINEIFELSKFSYNQQTILFNEEYIIEKFKKFKINLTYFHEFLDYRKSLLEKRKINNALKIKQNKNFAINKI